MFACFFLERSLSCEMTKLVSPSLDCALHAFLLCAHSFCLSHHFSVDVPLMPYCPSAEDVRRKARFQAPATGLALTMAL